MDASPRGEPVTKLRASEGAHQAALVQSIKLLGKRSGVDVIHIVNELYPPEGVKHRSPRYYGWLAKLEAKGYTPGACDLLVYWSYDSLSGEGGNPREPFNALFIECKAPGGRLRTSQTLHHADLRRRGIAHLVWDDGEPKTALDWLRAHGCPL